MTPRQLAMLLGLAALWGASFLFMRVAVPSFGPILLADARVVLAGVVLFAYSAVIGARPALRARWRDYLLLGSVNAALPFSLLAAAQLELEASLAAVLNAMAPLFGALVAAVWLGERVTLAAKAGLVLGVVGVALVVGLSPFTIDVAFVLSVIACLAAAFAYGVGANVVRVRFAGVPPLSIAVGQQLAAAVVLLPLIPAVPLRETPDAIDVVCVFALALGSTGIAYLLYFRLLSELGAAGGMTAIFVVPVFGVLWGALFLDERIHLGTLLGGAVILLSVWLITRTPAPALRHPPAECRSHEPSHASTSSSQTRSSATSPSGSRGSRS
jgi:drug/metabolite transporter (DMT)-like permease